MIWSAQPYFFAMHHDFNMSVILIHEQNALSIRPQSYLFFTDIDNFLINILKRTEKKPVKKFWSTSDKPLETDILWYKNFMPGSDIYL